MCHRSRLPGKSARNGIRKLVRHLSQEEVRVRCERRTCNENLPANKGGGGGGGSAASEPISMATMCTISGI